MSLKFEILMLGGQWLPICSKHHTFTIFIQFNLFIVSVQSSNWKLIQLNLSKLDQSHSIQIALIQLTSIQSPIFIQLKSWRFKAAAFQMQPDNSSFLLRFLWSVDVFDSYNKCIPDIPDSWRSLGHVTTWPEESESFIFLRPGLLSF